MPEEKTTKQKRRWFNLIAPKLFNNQIIGQTITKDKNKLAGRTLSINLMTVTRDPKKQTANIIFKITSLQEENALLDIFGYYGFIFVYNLRYIWLGNAKKISYLNLCSAIYKIVI